jgi:hypothetical protein
VDWRAQNPPPSANHPRSFSASAKCRYLLSHCVYGTRASAYPPQPGQESSRRCLSLAGHPGRSHLGHDQVQAGQRPMAATTSWCLRHLYRNTRPRRTPMGGRSLGRSGCGPESRDGRGSAPAHRQLDPFDTRYRSRSTSCRDDRWGKGAATSWLGRSSPAMLACLSRRDGSG